MTTAIDKIHKMVEGKEKKKIFSIGDVIKVHTKIREGDKDRIQIFTGTVVAIKGKGATETFTVRRVSYGVGVERVFPVYSPHIAQIELEKSSRIRRAKLYFLRGRSGKRARLTEKIQAS